MTYFDKALEKLSDDKKITGNKEKAIKEAVRQVLIDFCRQEEEFAQAIIESDKTFPECLQACVKGVGNSVSDIEVYRRACAFWFPTATVEMIMTIDLAGKRDITVSGNKDKDVLSMSFADFFDD